jgi:hypothetical protein
MIAIVRKKIFLMVGDPDGACRVGKTNLESSMISGTGYRRFGEGGDRPNLKAARNEKRRDRTPAILAKVKKSQFSQSIA